MRASEQVMAAINPKSYAACSRHLHKALIHVTDGQLSVTVQIMAVNRSPTDYSAFTCSCGALAKWHIQAKR